MIRFECDEGWGFKIKEFKMKAGYDFSKAKKNPYAKKIEKTDYY